MTFSSIVPDGTIWDPFTLLCSSGSMSKVALDIYLSMVLRLQTAILMDPGPIGTSLDGPDERKPLRKDSHYSFLSFSVYVEPFL